MPESLIFVSDVHIAPGNAERAQSFSDFLDMVKRKKITHLYILGDLFYYWVGRGHEKQPEYLSVLKKIRDVADSGVKVYFFHGNRDVFFGRKAARIAGLEIAGDEMELQVGEKTLHLCHGDDLCEKDKSYQVLRKCMRNSLVRIVYAACPFFVRERLGRKLLAISKQTVAEKSEEVLSFCADAVERIFQRGVDVLVCGHTHSSGKESIHSNGCERILYNVGDWSTDGSYLLYENNDFRLLRYGSNGGKK